MTPSFFRKTNSRLTYVVMTALLVQPIEALAGLPAETNRPHASASPALRVADVALQRGGLLEGQVVNASGHGEPNVVVRLKSGRATWQTDTDSRGWFRFSDLRGGAYQFEVSGQGQPIRAWSAGTAPPNATLGILVTPSTDVVRGQRVVSPRTNRFFRIMKQKFSEPLFVTGVALTAVAIPVAIHNSNDDDPPTSP